MWLGFAVIVGGVLTGSTWFLVGAADGVALLVAGIGMLTGVSAAWWRRTLDALPLELAPHAAVWDGVAGARVTVRARLGRGRRVDAVSVLASMDDAELPVIVHPGPAVGRFQAVITGLPAWHAARDLHVSVQVHEGDEVWEADQVYTPTDRRVGRFAPGVQVKGGVQLAPEWDQLG